MRLVGKSAALLCRRKFHATGGRQKRTSGQSRTKSQPKRITPGVTKEGAVGPESVAYGAPKAFVIGGTAGLLGSLAGMGGGFVMM